ncbi:MAG: PhoH family protein [Oligoflexia bacterium]|nr:PhoH family protein [Oligoflexia bacterium]
MENKKIFIIDTNVVLFDPHAVFKFAEHDVVIPIVVVEEVDRFKRDMSENGRNARTFSRVIDELRAQGALSKGIPLKSGGKLIIDIGNTEKIPELPDLDLTKADNQMLALAKKLSRDRKEKEVIFVSKDINLRIKADACGVRAEDYEPSKFEVEDIYTGTSSINVKGELIDEFYAKRKLNISLVDRKLNPNQFVFIKDDSNSNHTAIGRFDLAQNEIVPVFKPSEGLWGVYPRNAEQAFAIDLLLNDEIKLVSLVGKAGTGKTLLAIAAGLSKTVDEGLYSRLLVSRPVMPMGHDIGYLPGTIEEKLNPYMQPIFDNIDFLFGVSTVSKSTRRGAGKGTQELMNQGLLNIEPLTYIRGRTIPNQFMIVDEAQNLTPHELKTIITRAGDGTKIVLTGDTMQIDHPYLDSMNNGLANVVECFKNEAIAGHVTMVKGERSKLSELATQLMQ